MSGQSKAGKFLDYLTGSSSTKYFINKFIRDYGRITELRIDNRNKTLFASILLKGEIHPVELSIDEYVILKDAGLTSLLIKAAASNKPWLTAILKNHVVGIPWKIPADKTAVLNDFLG